MKYHLQFLLPTLLTLATLADAQEVVAQPNPLDFPGGPITGPIPGGPGGAPLLPFSPPVIINPAGPFTWVGAPIASPFASSSWSNASNVFATFSPNSTLDRNLAAANVQFNLSQNQILSLGTGTLTLTDSAMIGPNGGPSIHGISGNSSGIPSLLSVVGSTVALGSLSNLQIEAGDSGALNGGVTLVNLFANRSDHQNGTVFTGSTINLTGFSSFGLLYIDSSLGFPVGTQEVLDAYLPKVFFEGDSAELGLDPLVAEPGDNLILRRFTSTINLGTEQDPVFETYTSGYAFAPIPEPSAFLLSFLSLTLTLRRKR